jgi:hypothetical protein
MLRRVTAVTNEEQAMDTVKFEAGRIYQARSICDHSAVFSYRVIKRTDKTVTLKDLQLKRQSTRRVKIHNGVEYCHPEGAYSMCPTIKADRAAV